ncbi:MAG TPA: penicillin-binding transpeptidase domain-containing protein [Vicinamibacteria bacterium]|nr:penicillin-binding transpeptidase domain-containing protein [Vicinamibacteria bacterium]
MGLIPGGGLSRADSPAAARDAVPASHEVIELSSAFPGFRAAFVMRDVAAGRTVRHDPALAATRLSPCSTFKIPNSLIGLETGVIPDPSFVLPWDGKRREVEAWNRDHDLRSAIRDSVVWYYQELARRVGPRRMQRFVHAFGYGNQDTSGGVDRFWLGSTLRISADEQVEFLARLHRGELPGVSARSLAIVKEILVQDPPGPGLVYRGKTGSCSDPGAPPHGWWVGSVERDSRLVVFAALIEGDGASGRVCRPLAEKALVRLGVLPDVAR